MQDTKLLELLFLLLLVYYSSEDSILKDCPEVKRKDECKTDRDDSNFENKKSKKAHIFIFSFYAGIDDDDSSINMIYF